MPPPPQHPGAIPGYGLTPPGEPQARDALRRVFGADRGDGCWDQACRAVGLRSGHVLARPQFETAVRALAGQGGPAATIARSLEIRLRTYDRLAAHAAAAHAGGQA